MLYNYYTYFHLEIVNTVNQSGGGHILVVVLCSWHSSATAHLQMKYSIIIINNKLNYYYHTSELHTFIISTHGCQ